MQVSRKINHTGRRKIHHSEVKISIDDLSVTPQSFSVDFALENAGFPPNAEIFVEAYHRNTSQRFCYGTVAIPSKPISTTINQVDLSGPTLFRVKVVDNSNGESRLLGLADKLKPINDNDQDQKASLMIFKSTQLGDVTWRMQYNEEEMPVLCINNKIPQAKGQLLNNPLFHSLILPSALRDVLMHIVWSSELDDGISIDDASWQQKWLEFANSTAGYEFPSVIDSESVIQWIDDVVSAFSSQHKLTELLIQKLELNDHD